MPRIRTIKPEFWDSPDTARASLRARLFYIALWNWADDYGVGTANAKSLVGFAFPNDDDVSAKDFPSLRKEVADCFGVVFYKVAGRPYYAIPTWDKHQRTERKAKPQHPAPPEGVSAGQSTCDGTSDGTQGTSDAIDGSSGPGTGEQGNRGTGEEHSSSSADADAATPTADRFEEFWDEYPRKVGKQEAKRVFARLARRCAAEEIIDGARRLAADPNLPEREFIPHPKTWLNRGGWTDEPLPSRTERRLTVVDERRPSFWDRDVTGMGQR